MMKNIQSMNQEDIFSRSFQLNSFDSKFSDDTEVNEKFKIID